MKIVCVAVVAWILGAALGFFLCHATISHLRRRVQDLRLELRGKRGGMGTMDKVLLYEIAFLTLYVVADLIVFWHVGAEPATLTTCVFAFWGFESGIMGWIKTNKDKINGSSGNGQGAAEAPVERPEPPDAGA